MQESSYGWLWEGGSIALPKRLFALMDQLGLTVEDLGALAYILQWEGRIAERDTRSRELARHLASRGLIEWSEAAGTFRLAPLYRKVDGFCSGGACERAADPVAAYATFAKRLEQEHCRYLSDVEKPVVLKMFHEYQWPEDLVWAVYLFYLEEMKKRRYSLERFALEAKKAGVATLPAFRTYAETMGWEVQQLREVLERIGKYNHPTAAQRSLYQKWKSWGFSQELILLAADETVNADHPSLGYIDSVLGDWQKAGIMTPEAVAEHREAHRRRKALVKEQRSGARKVKNRHFDGGSGRDLSYLEE